MIDVLVLGASLPGMIVARTLLEDYGLGESLKIIGTGRPRSQRALGPMYLWHSLEVQRYMQEIWGVAESQYISNLRIKTNLWRLDSKRLTSWPSQEDLAGYKAMTKSCNAPCQGLYEIRVIENGLRDLWAFLHQDLTHRGALRDDKIECIKWFDRDRRFVVKGEKTFVRPRIIVNTLSLFDLLRLFGLEIPSDDLVINFHIGDRKPVSPAAFHDMFVNPKDAIVHSGREKYCRATLLEGSDKWVYESPDRLEGTWDEIVPMKAKVHRMPSSPKLPNVVQCGRWAEQNRELMVSDIIAQRENYAAKVGAMLP